MKSIRTHLAIRLLIVFVLLLSLACLLAYFIMQRIIRDDFDGRLFAKAQAVIASTTQRGTKLDIDWQELPQEVGTRRRPPSFVELLTVSGRPWGGKAFLDLTTFTVSNKKSFRNTTSIDGTRIRVLTLPFQPLVEEEDVAKTPDNIRQDCILLVGNDRSQLDRTLAQLTSVLIATTVLVSIIGVGVLFLVLRRGLHPLAKLSQEVAQLDASTLGHKIELDSLPTELAPIGEKLNDLLSRLEVSFLRERQFSADVSHELRTPITEVRLVSEIMLRQPDLPVESRKAFQDVFDASCQMETLVVALLEIVRGERNISLLEMETVNLHQLIFGCWKSYADKAEGKNLKVTFNLPEDVWVETDQGLLRLVFNNLFSNAVTYTPEGGSLDIDVQEFEEEYVISIQNTSLDVSPEDLSHFFERFWRKDDVRGTAEHFGLGLSLTQIICQRLQIQLTVSSPAANIVRFSVAFPISVAQDQVLV